MSANNPAGRLLDLIKDGQKLDRGQRSSEAWSELLGVSKGDFPTLLRRVGLVMRLPDLIREQMSCLKKINHKLYLDWLPQIDAQLKQLNFDLQWEHVLRPFDSKTLSQLAICDDLLKENRPEPSLSEQQLKDIKTEVQEFFKEVEESEIDSDLKDYILDQLKTISDAIIEYKISGCEPLKKTIEKVFGSILFNSEKIERLKAKYQNYWTGLCVIAGKVYIVISTIDKTVRIAQMAKDYFLPEWDGLPDLDLDHSNIDPDKPKDEVIDV